MNGSDSENVKVILSIGGTEYEGIECLLPLNRPIRECVDSFNLPRFDDGGNPLQYLLGRIREGDEEEILELEDEDGREMALFDYNIQSGDHLLLIPVPISGGSPTRPFSIPRKTSFLQSVRRWMKGLVTRREEINTTLFAPFMAERGTYSGASPPICSLTPQLNQTLSEPWQTKGSTLISPSCPT